MWVMRVTHAYIFTHNHHAHCPYAEWKRKSFYRESTNASIHHRAENNSSDYLYFLSKKTANSRRTFFQECNSGGKRISIKTKRDASNIWRKCVTIKSTDFVNALCFNSYVRLCDCDGNACAQWTTIKLFLGSNFSGRVRFHNLWKTHVLNFVHANGIPSFFPRKNEIARNEIGETSSNGRSIAKWNRHKINRKEFLVTFRFQFRPENISFEVKSRKKSRRQNWFDK